MKLLKRNLAFVLTLAMVLGLMVSASALNIKDYSDYNEITYLEAIDLLTSLGILEGTDGKFNPQDVLTREQGAKIIAYLMLGKEGAEALSTSVAPFKDVASGRWSAGFIAYCASQGIIGGYGNGNFGPTDTLTGNQFAKMLLVALGYGVNGEFTGPNWSIEVAKYALTEGIFDGNLGANFDAGTKREEAALYAFNALTGVMTVSYSETFGTYYSGKLFNSVDKFDEEYTLGYKLYNVKSKDTTDDFGREAHYWVKNSNTKLTETYHDAADATYTASVKSGKIYTDLGLTDTAEATVYVDGEKMDYTFQIKKGQTSVSTSSNVTNDTIKNHKNGIGAGNGVLVEAYVDEDENVTLIVINTYLAKVSSVDNGTVKVSFVYAPRGTSNEFDTAVEYEENDYVLVTVADGEIQSMVAAESKTGKIGTYAADYVKLGDEKINKSALLKAKQPSDTTEENEIFVTNFDNEMKVVLDEYGYAAAVVTKTESDDNYDYILVTDSEGRQDSLLNSKAAVVEVMHLDGKTEVLPLQTKRTNRTTQFKLDGKYEGHEINENGPLPGVGGWYRYTMTDNGEIVLKSLKTGKDAVAVGGTTVKFEADGKQKLKSLDGLGNYNVDSFILNSKTELHVVDEDSNKTFTGYKNINKTVTGTENEGGNVLFVFDGKLLTDIYVLDTKVSEDDIYAYYTGTTFETTDGTWVTMYVDGEAVNYKVDSRVTVSDKGIYMIKVEDNTLVSGTHNVVVESKVEATNKVTSAQEAYFQTGTKADNNVDKHYYDEDVKVFDMTDDGKPGTIARGDYVVYYTDPTSKFVTYAYIVSAPSKTVDPDDVKNDKYSIDVQQGKAIIKGEANAEITLVVEIYGKTDYNKYETVDKTIASDGTVTYNPADEGQYKITVKDANGKVLCSESELFLKPVVNPAP